MTIEKAIEILRKNRPASDTRQCGMELCDAVDMAISAIRQQETVTDRHQMTNEDRIRAMSDKELARFLASVENRRSADGGGAQWCGMAHALKWLQRPAEEDGHDERKENENV